MKRTTLLALVFLGAGLTPGGEAPEIRTRWPFDAPEARHRQEETARALGLPGRMELDLGRGERLRLVLVPAGEFLMGDTLSPEEADSRWPGRRLTFFKDPLPRHRVKLTRPFYIGECEVTRGQFAAFVLDTGHRTDAEKAGKAFTVRDGKLAEFEGVSWRDPGFEQTDRHPAVCISWRDATAFCEWLSRKSGMRGLLPTEAQWEYACRAGSDALWPWGDSQEDPQGQVSWPPRFKGPRDGYSYTAAVGSFAPNAFGLKDTIGNAWEWCSDWFAESYEGAGDVDPTGPAEGKNRILRGGCWFDPPRYCRAATRYRANPSGCASGFGFRVVVAPRAF